LGDDAGHTRFDAEVDAVDRARAADRGAFRLTTGSTGFPPPLTVDPSIILATNGWPVPETKPPR
jgi:hypothetical protein